MVEPWILYTLAAALLQTLRFMLQKRLSDGGLSPVGATFARFAFAAPVAAAVLALWLWTLARPLPALGPAFWGYILLGGMGQILATVCVLALFKRRNFAVGITLKKSEVLQTAALGFVVLGDPVGVMGGVALGLGVVALVILSDPGRVGGDPVPVWRRLATPSAGLGLAAGAFFACAAVGVRGATLEIAEVSTALRALVALAAITALQSLGLLVYFALFDRAQPLRVLRAWRGVALTGAASLAGSFCWFAAFSLQTAAYVHALGQVEILISALIGAAVFSERLTSREALGMLLLLGSISVLVLAG